MNNAALPNFGLSKERLRRKNGLIDNLDVTISRIMSLISCNTTLPVCFRKGRFYCNFIVKWILRCAESGSFINLRFKANESDLVYAGYTNFNHHSVQLNGIAESQSCMNTHKGCLQAGDDFPWIGR